MTPKRFDALVAEARELAEEAIEQIWPQYDRELQNIEVVVADEPPPETLREMGMTPPETLYGLYDGVPLNERGWDYGNALPDVISIFRGPIVRDCADDDEIVQEVSYTHRARVRALRRDDGRGDPGDRGSLLVRRRRRGGGRPAVASPTSMPRFAGHRAGGTSRPPEDEPARAARRSRQATNGGLGRLR